MNISRWFRASTICALSAASVIRVGAIVGAVVAMVVLAGVVTAAVISGGAGIVVGTGAVGAVTASGGGSGVVTAEDTRVELVGCAGAVQPAVMRMARVTNIAADPIPPVLRSIVQ